MLLWLGERDTRFRFASTVILHDGLLYASLALLVGHLYLAVIHPATRHALRGMVFGTVREDWARTHHARWMEPIDRPRREALAAGDPVGHPPRSSEC
jgi:formate dehydrogenase subunit gamma